MPRTPRAMLPVWPYGKAWSPGPEDWEGWETLKGFDKPSTKLSAQDLCSALTNTFVDFATYFDCPLEWVDIQFINGKNWGSTVRSHPELLVKMRFSA